MAARQPPFTFRGRSYAPATVFKVGLAVATLSLIVLIYAYTGQRIFYVQYFFLAVIATIVLSVSTVVACWGRVNMPRRQIARGAEAGTTPRKTSTAERTRPPETATAGGTQSPKTAVPPSSEFRAPKLADPAAGERSPALPGGGASAPAAPVPARVSVNVACPRCRTRFLAEGAKPFVAVCPGCGASGKIK